jgi:hypothetical protein
MLQMYLEVKLSIFIYFLFENMIEIPKEIEILGIQIVMPHHLNTWEIDVIGAFGSPLFGLL